MRIVSIFKPITIVDGYEILPIYLINEEGIIRNKYTGKIIESTKGNPYINISLKLKYGKSRSFGLHRVVANTWIEIHWDTTLVVDHMDFDPTNNDYTNLQFITQKENVNRSIEAGRHLVVGENGANARLKEVEVINICKSLEKDPYIKYADLLMQNGLEVTEANKDLVTKIRTGKLWKSISKDFDIKQVYHRSCMNSHKSIRPQVIKFLKSGYRITELYEKFNITETKEKDKFYKFAKRLLIKIKNNEI